MSKKNQILVCTHIPFQILANDFYLPIQAGAINKPVIGFIRDDVGDNISNKNPYYSELTALYWGWKHLDYDFLGLVHYRRYFKGTLKSSINDRIIYLITESECKAILQNSDVIVPKKRKYYIETLYNHYKRTLRPEPLIAAEEVIRENYPSYIAEFNNLKKRMSAHMFNMMIGNKKFLDQYLPWLFDILGKIENKVDSSNWTNYEKRYMGSVSELLLDVYLKTNKIKYKEVKFCELIKFATFKKGVNFLKAKFFGRKYKRSVK